MADRLYLNCWLTDPAMLNRAFQFGKLLDAFPYSKLAKRGPVLRVYAIEHAEPPVIEKEFPPGVPTDSILGAAGEFMQEDCSAQVDVAWDLWDFDESVQEWKLGPVAVTLLWFGPDFDNDFQDHLRVDFGLDSRFLPRKDTDTRVVQENIRSLLHFVGQLDGALALDRRQLASEGGGSFAEMLHDTLSGLKVI